MLPFAQTAVGGGGRKHLACHAVGCLALGQAREPVVFQTAQLHHGGTEKPLRQAIGLLVVVEFDGHGRVERAAPRPKRLDFLATDVVIVEQPARQRPEQRRLSRAVGPVQHVDPFGQRPDLDRVRETTPAFHAERTEQHDSGGLSIGPFGNTGSKIR